MLSGWIAHDASTMDHETTSDLITPLFVRWPTTMPSAHARTHRRVPRGPRGEVELSVSCASTTGCVPAEQGMVEGRHGHRRRRSRANGIRLQDGSGPSRGHRGLGMVRARARRPGSTRCSRGRGFGGPRRRRGRGVAAAQRRVILAFVLAGEGAASLDCRWKTDPRGPRSGRRAHLHAHRRAATPRDLRGGECSTTTSTWTATPPSPPGPPLAQPGLGRRVHAVRRRCGAD